jgi:glutaminyl-peptide cyclotransferase
MKYKLNLLFAAAALVMFGCDNAPKTNNITISPEAGTSYKSGDQVAVKAHYAADFKPDSIVYLIDSIKVGSLKDSSALNIKTDSMSLGPRIITARVYSGGKNQEISTNIVLLPSKAPIDYTFKTIKVFPHDTSCYTEGLLYQDGFLYESGGGQSQSPAGKSVDLSIGQSSLRKVNLNTGKVIQKTMVDPTVFAEGISIIGNKLVQLTWKEKIGYVYDKDTFKPLNTFNNNVGVEGWGLCFDGKRLYMDDSTNRIWFLDKDTYRQTGYIDVYDDKGPVSNINELEYIEGKIYANIWETNTIIAIDPKTGGVLERMDMTDLYPQAKRNLNADVLNGIAYDAQGKRIFLTGKKWDKLFQVAFVKK